MRLTDHNHDDDDQSHVFIYVSCLFMRQRIYVYIYIYIYMHLLSDYNLQLDFATKTVDDTYDCHDGVAAGTTRPFSSSY